MCASSHAHSSINSSNLRSYLDKKINQKQISIHNNLWIKATHLEDFDFFAKQVLRFC